MNKPKSILLCGAATAAMLGAVFLPVCSAQAPGDEQAIAQMVAEIAAQQVKLVANQKAIDEKLAAIEENMRVARIFVSRGGGTNPKK